MTRGPRITTRLIDPKLLLDAGFTFASGQLNQTEHCIGLTRPYIQGAIESGLGLVFVWDVGDRIMDATPETAHEDALHALEIASAMGVPGTVPIYFHLTGGRSTAWFNGIRQYVAWLRDVVFIQRFGVTACLEYCQVLAQTGMVDWLWVRDTDQHIDTPAITRLSFDSAAFDFRGEVLTVDRMGWPDPGAWMPINHEAGQLGRGTTSLIMSPEFNQLPESWKGALIAGMALRVSGESPLWAVNLQRAIDGAGDRINEASSRLLGYGIDPGEVAGHLADNPDFVNALATALAGRVGMIPTAREIGKATIDAYAARWSTSPVAPAP